MELCSFPNLVLNRGKENLQAEESLFRQQLCEILVAKNGGKRGEAEGKPGKGPSHFVLLFGNEL